MIIPNIRNNKIIIISDSNVWKLYKNYILKKFLNSIAKTEVITWIGPQGEKIKSIKNYELASNYILSKNINRNSLIIAIGGGAVSDFAGFLASTLLRGIRWIAIPTTLLAMIDASIGGKTAINVGAGKNLIGTFYPPIKIIIDTNFLKSFTSNKIIDYQTAYGELIKYAFLDEKIYKILIRQKPNIITNKLIHKCIDYKNKIVKKDPYEKKGIRFILNYGHTFGHAFEKQYNIPHGQAVLLGIEFILKHFTKNKTLLETKFYNLIKLHNLQNLLEIKKRNINQFLDFVLKDKKRSSSKYIKLVVINKIGSAQVVNVTLNTVMEKIKNEY
ncbi:MAG: 3-dehydroquinate synthase [Oligoflexia bacterium]|nr:3-dehydroquinate synthase [Oligoflexia bacterium]